jgi:small subunit ribosomal protein S15
MTPSEVKFLLQDTPSVVRKQIDTDERRQFVSQQAEIVRRLMTIENASASQIKKFNTARAVEMFQRSDVDTGSPEVQIAAMTVKILAIQAHLEKHNKDKSTKRRLEAAIGRRGKMLKYLRRTVCLSKLES